MPRGVYKKTEGHKQNLSLARKGMKFSDAHKKALSESRKGKPTWASTHKKEVREYMKGNQWNVGRKISEETRKKYSEVKKGISSKSWVVRGEKSHLWKGGITPINEKIRSSLEMKLWKKACLERDNFTCQKTEVRGGRLVVHHINNFADFPELRTSIENGIVLSMEAHIEFHIKYGKRNNTREQLEEFLGKRI